MSISYTSLFGSKLGPLLATFNSINAYRGTTIPGRIAGHVANFAGSDAQVASPLWSALSAFQSANGGLPSALQSLFQSTIIQDVGAALVLPDQSIGTALAALIADMRTNAETVSANVVAATATANAGNTGNAVIRLSTLARTGLVLENAYAETVGVTCTQDAQSGGGTAGQETVQFRGQTAAAGGSLNYPWPAGSGSAVSLACISAGASQQGGTQNWLKNSNFEAWTVANIPDGWHVTVGTAGTQILKTTAGGSFYDGLAAVAFIGDGSTLTALQHQLGVDTSVKATPTDQLAWNAWVKTSNTPASGILEVALVDGSGTSIQDTQGVSNVATVNLTTVGTTFVPVGGFFRTPRVLPATGIYLRIRLSTALSTGTSAYVDRLAMAESTPLYPGGPHVAPFSGSAGLIAGDGYSIAVTNSRAGQWQTGFFQMLPQMQSLGLLLPSTTGTPTRANSLIA